MNDTTYLDQLRRLIAEAPDGFDVAPLQFALAVAEAAASAGDAAADAGDRPQVWFLLARSGSMRPLTPDLIGGFNQFLAEQQSRPGRARMTVVLFDGQDPFEVVVDADRIGDVPELTTATYSARGVTPLYDALGNLIETADRRIAQRAESGRPAEDQLVLVFTDGLENASSRFDRARVFEMVKERQDDQGWTFVFMGANQDSYSTGGGLGFADGSVQDFAATPDSVRDSFAEFSRGTSSYRAKPRLRRQMENQLFFEGRKLAEEALLDQEADRD